MGHDAGIPLNVRVFVCVCVGGVEVCVRVRFFSNLEVPGALTLQHHIGELQLFTSK